MQVLSMSRLGGAASASSQISEVIISIPSLLKGMIG